AKGSGERANVGEAAAADAMSGGRRTGHENGRRNELAQDRAAQGFKPRLAQSLRRQRFVEDRRLLIERRPRQERRAYIGGQQIEIAGVAQRSVEHLPCDVGGLRPRSPATATKASSN